MSGKKYKLAGLALIIILLITLPLIVFLVSKPQSTKSSAAEEPIAIYKDGSITKSDLSNLSQELYNSSPSSLSSLELKNLVDAYIGRKILANQGLGFVSSTQEYGTVKQKLIETKFKNWKVESISFWLPPTDIDGNALDVTGNITTEDTGQTKEERKSNLKEVTKALAMAKSEFDEGKSLPTIASDILSSYKDLADKLGVNGSIFDGSTDNSAWSSPALISYDKANTGEFYKTLYSQGASDKGTVKVVMSENNMGGTAYKLIDFKDGESKSFDGWLSEQKASYNVIITDKAIREAN